MMQRLLTPLALFAALTILAAPVQFPAQPDAPELSAAAWIVVEQSSGVAIAEQNADEERAMASVTKLMTALVVREHAELTDRVRISENAAEIGEAEVGLVAGEVWSVRDLLAAVLVRSGNDAAYALAEHVGGSVAGFADLMNEMAVELGLEHSAFVNPHGLDEEGHYTSARDLAVIAVAALEDPVLAQLTRTRLIRFKAAPTGEDRIAANTNRLLGRYPGVVGMKTGYTGNAGRVLVSALEAEGRTFIGVVMGSEDHFADTSALFDYVTARVSVRDRFLAPLVEGEGGGGVTPAMLDSEQQVLIKTLHPLPAGLEQRTAWGDTPGTRAIEDMIRQMLPVSLGGSG
jgi:D-alanyl-D-alanine carboxypeptidase (penicillin-binding protein 5/6)